MEGVVVAQTQSGHQPDQSRPAPRRRRPQQRRDDAPITDATSGHSDQPTSSSAAQPHDSHPRRPRRPRPNNTRQVNAEGNDQHPSASSADQPQGSRPRRPRPPRSRNTQQVNNVEGGAESGSSQPPQSRGNSDGNANPRPRNRPNRPPKSDSPSGDQPGRSDKPTGRRAKFDGKLSQSTAEQPSKPSEKYKTSNPLGDDLASTLIRALSTPPYPDCPICFSSITPHHAIWSCSPSVPIIAREGEQVQYCWTSFHIGCIKSWASKSVKDVVEAWRARGEPERHGDWRCPGCQAKREVVPSGYKCFCDAVPEPKLARLSTPHSCGQPCSRVRESGCGHPCPLLCHPGPCPPCQVTTQFHCYCPRKSILSIRCGIGKGKRDLSCGNICGKPLACGKHSCTAVCHEGDCAKCPVREVTKCWCGKEEKEVDCSEGNPIECFVEGEAPWIGTYQCDQTCERYFDCGVHQCQKACHPPSTKPAPCPRSPDQVTHCPCGKHTIAPPGASNASQYDFSARPSCSAPIPTCSSPCFKPHAACAHPCAATCHNGPCPPCTVPVTHPCRCGASTRTLPCHELYEARAGADGTRVESAEKEKEILCNRPCTALRACGRHQCNRVCCPLASLASAAHKKGKKKAQDLSALGVGIGEERGGLHECDLQCPRMLSCGNHRCEERDHRGPCPPCLRSSFEELWCHCGRTVLEPPIPCGTQINCKYPCLRPPPACGHPSTPHACHSPDLPCPPCYVLTEKRCACGKKMMPNTRCSLETEKVSCGTVCGKLMSCGFHHCESLCHSGECGTCTSLCGKARKLCFPNQHPCTLTCHAPSSCSEAEPCQSTVTITCPCGRLKQAVQCGRSTSKPQGYQPPPLSCTSECAIAKRNARLAEALGINPDASQKEWNVAYSEELVVFARANPRFLLVVEKAFADFVASEKRNQVLPHMPPDKRKFVQDLASVYRMDTQMVDQEPNRSVQLVRRIDTRVPTPTLSAHLASSSHTPNLGKLADLRSMRSAQSQVSVDSSATAGGGGGGASSSGTPGASTSWRPGASSTTSNPVLSKNLSYVNVNSRPASAGPSLNKGWTSVVQARPPSRPAASESVNAVQPHGRSTPPPPPSSHLHLNLNPAVRLAGSSASEAVRSRMSSPQPPQPAQEPVVENWEDDV